MKDLLEGRLHWHILYARLSLLRLIRVGFGLGRITTGTERILETSTK